MTPTQRLVITLVLLLATFAPAYRPRHGTDRGRLARLERWLTGHRARRVTRSVLRRAAARRRAWERAEDVRLEAWAHTLNVGWAV